MASRLKLSVVRTGASALKSIEALEPASPLFPFGPPPALGIVQGPGTIGFTLNGTLRWLINVRWFAGTPTLTAKPTRNEGTRVTLKNARFPGTELPADFVLELARSGPGGTPADLSFTLGEFRAQVIFEHWLAGSQLMQSAIRLTTDVCPLGAGKLTLAGSGQARFFPTWLMQMGGPDLATVTGLGPSLVSDRCVLKLLFPTDPSLSTHPKSKRTLLSLVAGSHSWALEPAVTALPIGTLKARPDLFGRIDIEAGEGTTGDAAHYLIASSFRDDALALQVAGGIADLEGQPFALPLASPTYSIAFDPTPDRSEGDQTFLTARFSRSPTWLSVDGFSLQVGDSDGPPGFEVDTLNGSVTSVRCEPGLHSVAAPLASSAPGTLATKPLPITSGVRLPFVEAPGPDPGWGLVAGPTILGRRRMSLPDFGVAIVRRDDLLSLEFLFYNLALEGGGSKPPELVTKDASKAAYLVARFNAPQNIAEQAFLEVDPTPPSPSLPPGFEGPNPAGEVPAPPPVAALAAGPSRLAFRLPNTTKTLPYSLDDLLDWVSLEQSVVPVAAVTDPDQPGPQLPPPGGPPPQIREPEPTETAIEAPWRLFLSPNYTGAWAHSPTPVTMSGHTELWHTRLAVRSVKNNQPVADETIARRVRAVWSPDYDPFAIPPHSNTPFRMSLDSNDRDQVVRLSSDFTLPLPAGPPGSYPPVSVAADKLFLSSMGAWMDVFGNWKEPLPADGHSIFSVLQWQHRAAMARDNYVRVVYAGYLLCYGNSASLVKITERKLQSINGGPTTAYLRQRFFIIVREPEKDYSYLPPSRQRELPYRKIRITTLVTPNVAPTIVNGRYSFFPKVGANYFLFHIVATDWDGQTSEFPAPLYFVERGGDADYITATANYNAAGVGLIGMSGQKIAFAAANKPGDTTLHANTLTFAAQPTTAPFDVARPFFPKMSRAEVVVPSIQQLTGQSTAIPIEFYPPYLATDFGAGEVFARKVGAPLPVTFNGKQSGGVATPNLAVSGLSRKFGAVSGPTPDKVAAGNFDPADIFNDPGAKLFGVISIADLIDAVAGGDKSAPIVQTERLPTEIRTKMSLKPVAKDFNGGLIKLTFNGNRATALALDATIVASLTGAAPQVTIHGELNNFTISLAEVIGITFTQIAFDAPAGKKLIVSAKMPPTDDNGPLMFLGDLSFMNELRKFIPSDGFEDPPSLDVSAAGITAGYSLPIPTIAVGVFSIENIKLSAALTLPFFPPSPVRFRFAFSEREAPFLITVSLLGGGGFFGVAVGPDGVEMLEASIEVGANVSIDVFVASGNVHIMAGVYLKLDFVSKESQLTGYLRAGGSVDVLGLISASIEFYLGFTYYFGPPCSIAGEATITIEVHVLFFSASVSATLRRELADPTVSFADLIGPSDWDYYCDSFAA